MSEASEFGRIVLVVAAGAVLAIASSRLTERTRIPAPAVFLLAAAIASDAFPRMGTVLSIRDVERIGVVALIVILFDGGMQIGWRRFRSALWPALALGVAGTFLTAGVMAVAVHVLFGLSWTTAGLIGAALSPTDPAVMFSVLGGREVSGRSGVILQAESGLNDPVAIALMLGLLQIATADGSAGQIALDFVREMSVGILVGAAGGLALRWVMREVSLPDEALYPLRTLAAAAVIYGLASVLHGSGFLAVFVAGIAVADLRAPYKGEIEHFHRVLASLGELVVFVALGLTVDLASLGFRNVWLDGLLIALLLAFVARPLATMPLLAAARMATGEKLFVVWTGLKGAVPILLAAFAVLEGAGDARRIYGLVFVVVMFSVVVQGSMVPAVAGRLAVGMRRVDPEPWDVSIRLRHEPHEVLRLVVAGASPASGMAIRDLEIGEHAWIALVLHEGTAVQARGSYVLRTGDEVVVIGSADAEERLRRLFDPQTPVVPDPTDRISG
ncbi:MAG: potassium/proton antiporter [Solirubrobacteraceae bacterium]